MSSLGEGGMAEVFLAKNSLGKKFTIKVLKPELFSREAIKQRFVNEADSYHDFGQAMQKACANQTEVAAWLICEAHRAAGLRRGAGQQMLDVGLQILGRLRQPGQLNSNRFEPIAGRSGSWA